MDFSKFLADMGMQHKLTTPHILQQNGVAEQANHTVAKATQAILQAAGMSLGFWEFAVATAVHIQNQAPSWVVGYVPSHEHLLKLALDLSYLYTFGCLAYTHTTTQ